LNDLHDADLKGSIREPEKTAYKLFDFFANCEYFEKDFKYDEVLAFTVEDIKKPDYKKAYEAAYEYGTAGDELVVTCGIVHSYNKHVGKVSLYTPELNFKVK
jgi:hypothetical protein